MERSHLLAIALVAGSLLSRATAQTVPIPDPGLRTAIRAALNKPTGDLTVTDMESLIVLDASLSARIAVRPRRWLPPIRSLEGLQTARNLTNLNLRGVGVGLGRVVANLTTGDLSVLSTLAHLQTLDLSNNGLMSLSLPADLTGLTTLELHGNWLTDFAFLSGLSSLRSLNLGYNQLTSLTLPEGLSSLEWADWQTLTLDGPSAELTDATPHTTPRFYRARRLP